MRPRSIPTCVGLTLPGPRRAGRCSVHPHVRGAHGSPDLCTIVTRGPSPRAWGSLTLENPGGVGGRSIPTCVGLTGSCAHDPHRRRSIPTCVGLTACTRRSGPGAPVHPHVRGAHRSAPPIDRFTAVHPHVRGAHPGPGRRGGVRPVHPHVRGAHERQKERLGGFAGPSPRAWGSHPLDGDAALEWRSIPTCVGLTLMTCNNAGRYLRDTYSPVKKQPASAVLHRQRPAPLPLPGILSRTLERMRGRSGLPGGRAPALPHPPTRALSTTYSSDGPSRHPTPV